MNILYIVNRDIFSFHTIKWFEMPVKHIERPVYEHFFNINID